MSAAAEFIDRYEPRRRPFEVGFWLVYFLINAVANSLTVMQDVERRGLDVAAWEAITWESSSALAALVLIPPIVWLTRRYPLQWRDWKGLIGIHLLGSVIYTLAHVLLMVGLREAVYAWMASDYSFGDWPRELAYEYLKDARSYVGLVLMIEGYRFLLRRLRGEARWPDPAGPEIEPASERPERFVVKMLGREFLVPADKIESVSAAGNYVNLRVAGREYPLRSTMKDLMARLDPQAFQRVHRSHAIRIDQLSEIRPGEHGDAALVLHNGQVLPCSKSFRSRLDQRIA
jgi:DNA-binding LytR/AlgR family response regulator